MCDRKFFNLYEEPRGGRALTLMPAKVPQDLQTDQTIHLMGDFARRAAREADDYREYPGDEPDSVVFINPDGMRAELETTHGLLYRKTRSWVVRY